MRILCACVLLLLAACGDPAPPPTPARALNTGEPLPPGVALPRSSDPAGAVDVAGLCGSKATVFYAWSVPCPCVANAEARIRKLVERFGPHVAWIAVDGEPLDTPEQVREKRLRMGSPYTILLDPQQVLCKRLGLDSACQVAVLDHARRLVYRGALDAEYIGGKGEYVADVLTAVLFGKDVAVSRRARTYGCYFNDPASCTQNAR